MDSNSGNVDPAEISKFEAAASKWWDRRGEFRALHDINDTRVDYIDGRAPLINKKVIDVGCGGGLLSEAMAARGAVVTGIDMGKAPLEVARQHVLTKGYTIDYRRSTAEAFAEDRPGHYDMAVCLELLEHVPDPKAIVQACEKLVRPGGDVFFATLNRNFISGLLVIWIAETIFGLMARGTHRYKRFVKPKELVRWGQAAGLSLKDLSGLYYLPFIRFSTLGRHTTVNYLAHFKRGKQDP